MNDENNTAQQIRLIKELTDEIDGVIQFTNYNHKQEVDNISEDQKGTIA
jgi:ABC-type uncharacterized transport system substrate-binding protein